MNYCTIVSLSFEAVYSMGDRLLTTDYDAETSYTCTSSAVNLGMTLIGDSPRIAVVGFQFKLSPSNDRLQ